MTFDDLLGAVERAYNATNIQGRINIPCPDAEDLIFLLRCILDNNYFEFNNKVYKQTIGASMGQISSPHTCDIRMFEITNFITNHYKYNNKILYHGRYRDDGFILFDGNREEMEEFFYIGNSVHELLKFTYQISDTNMVFLDTEVYKGQRFTESGVLDIKSYLKPTNNFQYLHRQSAHSPSVFKAFIKGECIRHLRNTSDLEILVSNLSQFKCHLMKRGYKETEIDPIIQNTLSLNRTTMLNHKKNTNKSDIPLVMVTKFDPRIKGLKRKLLKHWKAISKDEYCKKYSKMNQYWLTKSIKT